MRLGDWETRGGGKAARTGLREAGKRDRRGRGDAGTRGRGDAVNKREFLGVLDLYDGEFVCRLVADDFQRSWFGLICLLAKEQIYIELL